MLRIMGLLSFRGGDVRLWWRPEVVNFYRGGCLQRTAVVGIAGNCQCGMGLRRKTALAAMAS